MTHFLPSYFQKRLLRYALTRLDLIETDDLNLDDLGLTFGQRSVVELKNVSIKVKRIVERANLPPSFLIDHASIRLLRVTIPADLHASGIQVEVEGVDVRVRLSQEDPTVVTPTAQKPQTYGPSHADKANRPRNTSPSIYDPGGTRSRERRSRHVEISKVLPSSKDLAASFLETEPVQEKEELEAAIGSQSRLHESSVSSSTFGDEGDVGMADGFTLPSFVASFFQGVADRLALVVTNVTITVQLVLSTDDSDSATFVLKFGMIDVASASSTLHQTGSDETSRKVSVQDVRFGLEVDRDILSEASSPRLGRASLARVLSGSNHDTATVSSPSRVSTLDSGDSGCAPNLNASLADFGSQVGLGLQDSSPQITSSSAIFQPSIYHATNSTQTSEQDNPGVDNKAHAEMQSSAGLPSPDRVSASTSSNEANPLSESRLFTHEEAESMYMSAVSSGRAMPGGWDWSNSVSQQEEAPQIELPDARNAPEGLDIPTRFESTPEATPRSQSPFTPPKAQEASISSRLEHKIPEGDSSSTLLMRIFHLDNVSLSILNSLHSTQQEPNTMGQRSLPSVPVRSIRTTVPNVNVGASLAYSTITPQQSQEPPLETRPGIEIEAGTLVVDADLRTAKIVVRVTQSLLRRFPPARPVSSEKAVTETTTSSLGVAFALKSVLINFWDQSNLRLETSLGNQASDSSPKDDPLLCLSLSSIRYNQDREQKTFTITKIAVRHNSREVLSFIDAVSVRDSIMGSTMLRPHDLALSTTDGRIEVQIKPVHVILDLLVMDEVLSRSGGLSSLIDLGNSIASTASINKAASSPNKPNVHHRTVRFNEPRRRSCSESDPSSFGSKINLRLGGSVIDLVGSDASIQVKSTAVKFAWRDGQARIVIDGVAIEGPLLPNTRSPPGVLITAKSIDIRYLDVPEESDLDRLLSLITPSSDRYDTDDDIMVDTLLRQRQKGSVLRLAVGETKIHARGLDWQGRFVKLSEEISKLSSVTKYLPEDDRPGILTFGLLNKFEFRIDLDQVFGPLVLRADLIEGTHISLPSLAAAQVSSWTLARGEKEVMIGEVLSQSDTIMGAPMLMCRFLADEMEPTVRLKLSNTCLEYKVSTVIALTELLKRLSQSTNPPSPPRDVLSRQSSPAASSSSEESSTLVRKVRVSAEFRDSAIALHPTGSPAKGLFVLTDTVFGYDVHKRSAAISLEIKKASLLIINNTEVLAEDANNADQKIYFDQNDQIQQLAKHGFVPVGTMSAASAIIRMSSGDDDNEQQLDVEFRNNLLFLETCADSTQTLIQILNGLTPPTPPSTKAKYRTEVVPLADMLASFTGNAFVTEAGPELGLQASQVTTSSSAWEEDQQEDNDDDGEFMNDLYVEEDDTGDQMTASYVESELPQSTASLQIGPVDPTAPDEEDLGRSMIAHSMLDFRGDHFATKPSVEGTAHRWDSTKNTYGLASEKDFQKSPLKIRIRDVHIIWNLFDGYDWQATRDTISHAVRDIETKAMMRRPRGGARSPGVEQEDDVVGDVLFNSIYISVPANRDPRDLTSAINHEIDDMVSETGSYATSTTVTATPSRRQSGQTFRPKKLKLNRSRQHKMSFELEGVSVDIVTFPPESGEVQSSVDVRVRKLEIFDNLPTSTWKKFATYMHETGEREVDTSMVHLELLNVRPVADLDASEIVMKLTILPLRLHVDQDALDFLTRFFEFKDDSVSPSIAPSIPPFIQRAEVNPIRLRLDYKPKKVDYSALRSGRTTEFMNFIILERTDMVLRRVILYGVSGFDRLGIMLNNIWSPDVRRNQLGSVLSGLAPVRPLIDVASGVRDLIAVPIREYKKDGRIVRSIQKGAIAFAKTTTTELVHLGAKLAIGTQQILQNAEGLLTENENTGSTDEEATKQRSLYADQPLGIVQGLRGAYASLERDLLLARDAIVAVPGEVMASDSATGAARAVLKQSPTIILRPAIGATKAVGQTLLGAGNTLDKRNLRRIEDKYKRH